MEFNSGLPDGPLEGFEPEEMYAEIMAALRKTFMKKRLSRRVRVSFTTGTTTPLKRRKMTHSLVIGSTDRLQFTIK